jgi:tetratricopeptide (TPR) repeat protein
MDTISDEHIQVGIQQPAEGAPYAETLGRDSALVLFLIAFGFRLIYIIQSTDNPLFGFPVVDAHIYAKWAAKMANGNWLWDHVGNYLPIYPAFLALQQIIFGESPFVNKIIQGLMGSLCAVMLAQIATRVWNRKVGLIAGYLVATSWMLVIFESEKYAESFSIFFQTLTIWLLIHMIRRSWALLAAGFAFALSAGTRANLFLALPFVIGWLIFQYKDHWPMAIRAAVLFSIGTIVLIGPIIVRNYHLTSVPILRTQATWSLYSGLSPRFEGLHPPTGILFQKYMRMPYQAGLRTEAEVERFWVEKTWKILRENPFGVAANFFRRLVVFFNIREWSQEFDVYAYRRYSGILSLPWTGFWLIGPLGLLGLLLTRQVSKNQALLIIYTLVGIISIVPFKASDRYRLPAAVLLTLFAAFALWQLTKWLQIKNKRELLIALPVLGVLCLLSWPDWQNLAARKTARHDFFMGLRYESAGRLDDALQAYQASMQEFAWDPDSPYRIAYILARQSQFENARDYLKKALARETQFPEALNEMSRLDLQAGNLKEAENQAHTSLQLFPNYKDTLLLMAQIRRQQGNIADEIAYFEKAIYETKDPVIAVKLGIRLTDLQKYEEAIKWYGYIINSPKVDVTIRARAAMFAGITVARFSDDQAGANVYWRLLTQQFDGATFFSQPADFLLGRVNEATFRRHINSSLDEMAFGEYVIGLKQRIDGDKQSAASAFERCLKLSTEKDPHKLKIPYKWAWQDLQQIRAENSN